MLKRFLTILFVFVFMLMSKGTHIIGGYLHYEQLGPDLYKVTITVYKDCQDFINGNGTLTTPVEFDNIHGQPPMFLNTPDALLSVHSYNNDGVVDSTGYYFTDLVISDVNIEDPDSCRNVPAEVCVQKGVYTITLSLPDTTQSGYFLSYQRCCRNPSSINVDIHPGETGITIAGFIPKLNSVPENSNPNYVNNPPVAFCLFSPIEHDLSAYDDDGDSLAYQLTTPLDGAGIGQNIVIPPPYGLIDYNTGYSATYPITGSPAFQIDPITGILTGTPTQLGAYIVGVKVLEYRNSILVSETIRDLRFYVLDCGEILAEFETEDHICDGIDTVEFTSYSSDVLTFAWNFGDSTTTNDSSSLEHPSYAYANNGQYIVSLLTNEGTTCEDLDTHIVNFRNTIDVEIDDVNMQCLDGNSFNFSILSYDFPPGTSLDWNFGPQASQPTGSGFNVNGISYPDYGTYDVTLTATYNFCEATSTIQVGIYPEIIVDIPDILIGCIDEAFTVEPTVTNPNYTYSWSLGGVHVSNNTSFQMTIDSITLLDLELEITDNFGCSRTITKSQWLHIKNQSIAEFAVSDTVIYIGEVIDLTNFASDYTSLVYHFGNGDSTINENPSYIYDEEGIYTITQVVDNGGNCPDYYHRTVEVRYDHYIYFPNVFTPNGDGLNDTFFPVRDGIKSYSLEIYDRWGKKVYNGMVQKSYHEWDGVYESGIEGAQEVYNYFSTYITDKEDVHSVQGVVLLLK